MAHQSGSCLTVEGYCRIRDPALEWKTPMCLVCDTQKWYSTAFLKDGSQASLGRLEVDVAIQESISSRMTSVYNGMKYNSFEKLGECNERWFKYALTPNLYVVSITHPSTRGPKFAYCIRTPNRTACDERHIDNDTHVKVHARNGGGMTVNWCECH